MAVREKLFPAVYVQKKSSLAHAAPLAGQAYSYLLMFKVLFLLVCLLYHNSCDSRAIIKSASCKTPAAHTGSCQLPARMQECHELMQQDEIPCLSAMTLMFSFIPLSSPSILSAFRCLKLS